ncbi:MAG: PDZ domain-containing protein, partial [Candidatus Dormibacteraeota bacterium]|nr:PDZ domain-containing protein [Candidatus Dormibacteraeota bacterium]
VITKVGSEDVNSVDQMLVALRKSSPGSSVQVGYSRSGSSRTAGVPVSG